jgi:hypothetical protein
MNLLLLARIFNIRKGAPGVGYWLSPGPFHRYNLKACMYVGVEREAGKIKAVVYIGAKY